MGVPAFYKWLVERYPNIVVPAREAKGELIDTTEPNPNGMEFDNLYLDMNGIIHPCFHPEDELFPPTTFDQVFQRIFEYMDRLFQIVRPRKLLYLAIDGVVPRAKMNQQRSRRFRTAKDAEILEAEEERLRREFEREGKMVRAKIFSEVSDSNIITPGTEFMYKLSKVLQDYICLRLNTEPGWKNIMVILSDANVPGEGEHKIMNFIRLQRNRDGYNPNTRHCLYGLDADLIMLALSTHELYFSILREDVSMQQLNFVQAPKAGISEGSSGLVTSTGLCDEIHKTKEVTPLVKKPYEFVNIWTLREYLELDMKILDSPTQIDLERIIDDFIFICFFIGNDFLPHIPSLVINERAINLMMAVYRSESSSPKEYLVDMERVDDNKHGYVKLKRVEKFLQSVGTYEEKIFKKRMDLRERRRRSAVKKLSQEMARDANVLKYEAVEDCQDDIVPYRIDKLEINDTRCSKESCSENLSSHPALGDNDENNVLKNTRELKQQLKDIMREKGDLFKQGGLEMDKIRLGSHGWRDRYYKEKFAAESAKDIENIRNEIVQKFAEGLCWMLQYYFSGVRSWNWFYPYHQSPFASDFRGLGRVIIKLDKGAPFKPFDQLMGVLPPRSAGCLPKPFQPLMTSEQSPIKEFYPTDFEVDLDGKWYLWQGIIKLPFIIEERLTTETKKLENELKEDELMRNSVGKDKIFVMRSHDLGIQIESIEKATGIHSIDANASLGITGYISMCDDNSGLGNSALYIKRMEDSRVDNVICALYEGPASRPHCPRLPEGVIIPEKTITEADIMEEPLWHEYEGFHPSNKLHSYHARRVINEGKPEVSGSSSAKEIFKGTGSGWSAGRGKGNSETLNPMQNHKYFRGTQESNRWASGGGNEYNGSLPNASWVVAPGPLMGRGRTDPNQTCWKDNASYSKSRRGSGTYGGMRMENNGSSWNDSKIVSPGPMMGRGRTGSSQASWGENVSYPNSGRGSGGMHMENSGSSWNGSRIVSPGPMMGRGRTGLSQASWGENVSYPNSGRGSGEMYMENGGSSWNGSQIVSPGPMMGRGRMGPSQVSLGENASYPNSGRGSGGMCMENSGSSWNGSKIVSPGPMMGRGRTGSSQASWGQNASYPNSGRGSGGMRMENNGSSWNGSKIVSPGPMMGRGRTGPSQAILGENASYPNLGRGIQMENNGFWPSRSTPTGERTNVWRLKDSTSAGGGY